jgi:polyphosphate kinase
MSSESEVMVDRADVSDAGSVVAQLKSSEAIAKQTISKEIAWLAFNERVLQEAADREVPLFERIKFLGIFSSNLDEFFRIRVATLKRLCQIGGRGKKLLGHTPRKILNEVQEIVRRQHQVFDEIYGQVRHELSEQGIHIVNEQQLSAEQGRYVKHFFRSKVRPKLFPLMIDQVGPFPEIRDQVGYLAVSLAKKESSKKRKYALIEIPTSSLSRFVVLPPHDGKQYIILLDDVIRYGLSEIFSVFGFLHQEAYTIKLTRMPNWSSTTISGKATSRKSPRVSSTARKARRCGSYMTPACRDRCYGYSCVISSSMARTRLSPGHATTTFATS